jgi:hypothetical protein
MRIVKSKLERVVVAIGCILIVGFFGWCTVESVSQGFPIWATIFGVLTVVMAFGGEVSDDETYVDLGASDTRLAESKFERFGPAVVFTFLVGVLGLLTVAAASQGLPREAAIFGGLTIFGALSLVVAVRTYRKARKELGAKQ